MSCRVLNGNDNWGNQLWRNSEVGKGSRTKGPDKRSKVQGGEDRQWTDKQQQAKEEHDARYRNDQRSLAGGLCFCLCLDHLTRASTALAAANGP